MYYRFLSPSNCYQVIGNPNLEPEYAHSWQFGGRYIAPQQRARLGVNLFRNDVRDLIESVSLGFVATPQQLADVLAREGLDPSFRPALGRLLLTYRNLFGVAFISQRIARRLAAFLTIENIGNSQDPNTVMLLPTGAPAPIYRPDAGRTARVGVQWSFSAR